MPKRTKDYDNVFKTLKMKHRRLFIAVINDAFGKHYSKEANVDVLSSEGYLSEGGTAAGDRKIEELISDFLLRIEGEVYLLECQSYDDDSMAIRISEYTFLAARQLAVWDIGRAVIPLPRFLVIYIKRTARTPKTTKVSFVFPDGQTVDYESDNVILADFTREEIIEKRLFVYIPFYIARYEKEIASGSSVGQAEQDLEYFMQEMLRLHEAGELSDYELLDLCGFVNTIITHIADGNKDEERLVQVMGGTIMETESERLLREGMEKGIEKGMEKGIEKGINQGQDRILTLNNILLSENRIEDLRHATEDADYRNQLFEKLGISESKAVYSQ